MLGEKIRQLRRKARLSQQMLSDEVGLRQSAISDIEKNRRRLWVDELPKFARALGVSVTDLLDGEEEEAQ